MAGRIRFGPQQPEITLRSGENVPLVRLKERAAARAIDLVPAGLVLVFATALMGCLAYASLATGDEYEPYGWLLAPLAIVFVALFLTAAYETWTTSATGQTRGKRLKGIHVVRLRDGRKPGVAASFVRAALPASASLLGLTLIWRASPLIATLVAAALYCLTYLSAIWNRRGRAWHDSLSQTLVTTRVTNGR
ncbi:RDD family protein [Candidatus Poriferisodalis sp.]|uniref:RDD family protein n=1 Tax=Candidatus Poriferisodalis sp. TaxID=3101277 RepID=UPI003B590936